MTDSDRNRTKALYCRHQAKDGRVCVLYKNHYGDHKENHLKSSWTDKD